MTKTINTDMVVKNQNQGKKEPNFKFMFAEIVYHYFNLKLLYNQVDNLETKEQKLEYLKYSKDTLDKILLKHIDYGLSAVGGFHDEQLNNLGSFRLNETCSAKYKPEYYSDFITYPMLFKGFEAYTAISDYERNINRLIKENSPDPLTYSNITDVKAYLETLSTTKEKLNYLINLKNNYYLQKSVVAQAADFDFLKPSFVQCIGIEINRIKELDELNNQYQKESSSEKLQVPKKLKLKSYNIKWNLKTADNKKGFSQNDFLELIKALIEVKAIIGTQKDIIQAFSELLQVEIKHPDQQIQSMKNRNNDISTKFIDSLKEALLDWKENG